MVLTDQGSPRIGLHEHIEMRAGQRSATITRDAYMSEKKDRIFRKDSVHKYENYQRMYADIISRIENGQQGESVRTLNVSTGLVLSLEEAYQQMQ